MLFNYFFLLEKSVEIQFGMNIRQKNSHQNSFSRQTVFFFVFFFVAVLFSVLIVTLFFSCIYLGFFYDLFILCCKRVLLKPPTNRPLTTYLPTHRPLTHQLTIIKIAKTEDHILNMFCIL